ncbi:MAG: RHS repeat-associated core domain-containing protein [Pseudomonadota bacterium]
MKNTLIAAVASLILLALPTAVHAQQEKSAQPLGVVEEYMGAYTKSIPIAVPAYHGIEPGLALSYSSAAGNGFVGVGWTLSGFPFIERRGENKFAGPTYSSADTYLLGGTELLPCTSIAECSLTAGSQLPTAANPGGYYHTKIESFQRILFDTSNDRWILTSKNAVQSVYGGTARFVSSSGIFRWLLSSVTNLRNQTATYTWECGTSPAYTCYPKSVNYGAGHFTVDLIRESGRPDAVSFGLGGNALEVGLVAERLKTIQVKVDGTLLRKYQLTYRSDGVSSRSLLEQITQYGTNGTTPLPAVSFEYTSDALTLRNQASTVPAGVACNDPEGQSLLPVLTGQFNDDTCTDFLWDDYSNPPGPKVWLAKCDGSGQFVGFYKTAPTGWVSDPARWKFGDFNGDGMTDVMVIPYSISDTSPVTFQVYLAKGDGMFRGPYPGPTRTVHYLDDWPRKIDLASIMVGDFNGDGADDLITFECQGFPCANGTPNVYFSNPTVDPVQFNPPVNSAYLTGPFHGRPSYPETLADLSRVKLADVNGDGVTDVLMIQGVNTNEATAAYMTLYLAMGGGQFWSTGIAPKVPFSYDSYQAGAGVKSDERVRIADVNGDGFADVTYIGNAFGTRRTEIYLSNGRNRFMTPPITTGPTLDLSAGQDVALGDFNGDGRTDLGYIPPSGSPSIYLSTGYLSFGRTVQAPAGGSCHWVGDFNGDGKTDIAVSAGTYVAFNVATGGPADLLRRIGNGYGAVEQIAYRPSSEIATNSPGLPIRALVESRSVWDGRGPAAVTGYEYDGGVYERSEKNFQGFEKVTVHAPKLSNEINRPKVVTHFNLDDRSVPLPGQIETYDSDGKLRSLTKNWVALSNNYPFSWHISDSWEFAFDASHAFPLPEAALDPALVSRGDIEGWWAKGTIDPKARRTLTSFVYDNDSSAAKGYSNGIAVGNLVWAFNYGDYDVAGDETRTTTRFHTDPANWLMDRPETRTVTTFLPTNLLAEKILSETRYTYNAQGEVTREERLLADAPISTGGDEPLDPNTPPNFTWCAIATCDHTTGQVRCIKPSAGFVACPYAFSSAYPKYSKCEEILFKGHLQITEGLLGQPDPFCMPAAVSTPTPTPTPTPAGPGGGGGGGRGGGILPRMSLLLIPEASAADLGSSEVASSSDPSLWDRVVGWVKAPFQTLTLAVAGTPRWVATTRDYDSDGNVLWTRDELGNQTDFTYDPTFNLYPASVRTPPNQQGTRHTTLTEWHPVCGVPIRVTDPNNVVIRTDYDALCRPYSKNIEAPLTGELEHRTYCNSCGIVGSQYDEVLTPGPNGEDPTWARTYFDGLGRTFWTAREGPQEGQEIHELVDFDERGNAAAKSLPYYTGAAQKFETMAYDSFNRVVSVTHADSNHVSTTYETLRDSSVDGTRALEIATIMDEMGHQSKVFSDIRGRKIFMRHLHNGSWQTTGTFTYDLVGNLLFTKDVGNATESYTYDTLGRKRTTDSPHIGLWTYEYDDAGHKTRQLDAISPANDTRWQYDALGRLVSKTLSLGKAGETTYGYVYDETRPGAYNIGKRTTMTGPDSTEMYNFDALGRPETSQRTMTGDPYLYGFQWGYDLAGRLLWTLYPDLDQVGSPANPLSYDRAGRLTTIPGILQNATYNAAGSPSFWSYGNGTTTIRFYDLNRLWLTDIMTTAIGQHFAYAPDAEGKATKASPDYTHFDYDDLHRLTDTTGIASQHFDYALNGNIQQATGVGSYSYNFSVGGRALPHAVSQAGGFTYQYDADGNMTNRNGVAITYDGEGKPKTVGADQFFYDGDGVRIKKVHNGITTVYFGDGTEITDCQTKKYISFNGIPVAEKTNTNTRFLHADRLGTIQAVTDPYGVLVSTRQYKPYGDQLAGGGDGVAIGFTGQRQDESGLIYLHARYYDPSIGRFIAPDPLIDTGSSQGMNAYQYADNDPMNKTDVTGMAAEGRTRPALNVCTSFGECFDNTSPVNQSAASDATRIGPAPGAQIPWNQWADQGTGIPGWTKAVRQYQEMAKLTSSATGDLRYALAAGLIPANGLDIGLMVATWGIGKYAAAAFQEMEMVWVLRGAAGAEVKGTLVSGVGTGRVSGASSAALRTLPDDMVPGFRITNARELEDAWTAGNRYYAFGHNDPGEFMIFRGPKRAFLPSPSPAHQEATTIYQNTVIIPNGMRPVFVWEGGWEAALPPIPVH